MYNKLFKRVEQYIYLKYVPDKGPKLYKVSALLLDEYIQMQVFIEV